MAISAVESNGKSEQTEALYRTHGAAVAALCWSLLRDRAEVEDATQQVFLSAHSALLNGTVPREPLAWLLSVARNECYARFRRRATAPVPAGEGPDGAVADASVHALRAGELASMWDEIGRMPPAQREAFLLREIRGLSYRQLADQLSLSPPSVRSLLLRARTRLRHRLGDVTAAVGGVPWVQALVRIVVGGDGTSPVPAATKAAAVGLGALVLAGGGALPHVAQHASATSPHPSAPHRVGEHVARVARLAVATPPREDRSEHDAGSAGTSTEPENRASRGSGSNRPESPGGSDDGGGITPVAVPVAPPTTDGGGVDASGSSSPGPGSGSSSGSSDGSDGGGSSGSGTRDTTTTTAQSSSDGGHSGPDGGSGSTTTSSGSGSGSGSGSDDGLPGG